jgi:hypothetical protein
MIKVAIIRISLSRCDEVPSLDRLRFDRSARLTLSYRELSGTREVGAVLDPIDVDKLLSTTPSCRLSFLPSGLEGLSH